MHMPWESTICNFSKLMKDYDFSFGKKKPINLSHGTRIYLNELRKRLCMAKISMGF